MFSVALRGKISITEDVLTAAFFDALADEHDVALLQTIIQTAHACGPLPVVPDRFAFTVELWPRTPAGEPDVRIQLHEDGASIAAAKQLKSIVGAAIEMAQGSDAEALALHGSVDQRQA